MLPTSKDLKTTRFYFGGGSEKQKNTVLSKKYYAFNFLLV